MPYKLFRSGKKTCVRNTDTGENKGCSDSRDMAVAHMRRLYQVENEKKSIEEIDAMVQKAIDEFDADLETKEVVEEKGWVPWNVVTFSDLQTYRENEDRAEAVYSLTSDFLGLTRNVMTSTEITDKASAVKSLADEFATLVENPPMDEKAKRSDVSEADKKRAVAEYGNVQYADPTNKKYPIDRKHVRAAWSYINMPKNAKKYSSGALATIKRRIAAAFKKFFGHEPPKIAAAAKEISEAAHGMALIEDALMVMKELAGLEDANFVDLIDDEDFPPLDIPDEPSSEKSADFLIFKDAGGNYKWFARYTNNYLDDDRPREIISKASHVRFQEKVEKGEYPLPQLWLWHNNIHWGDAEITGYDVVGDAIFPFAAGSIRKGYEALAEEISSIPIENTGVSHGMPVSSIVRNKDDSSIIEEHQTYEISPLPAKFAANKLASFMVLRPETTKEINMIDDNKIAELLNWGISKETLASLQQRDEQDAQRAKEVGLAKKEKPEETPEDDASLPGEEAPEETPEETSEEIPAEPPVTRKEIAEVIVETVKPIMEVQKQLAEALESLTKQINTLQETDEQKIAKKAKDIPSASLGFLVAQSIIGKDAALVSATDELANAGPEQTEEKSNAGPVGVSFLDDIITGNLPSADKRGRN